MVSNGFNDRYDSTQTYVNDSTSPWTNSFYFRFDSTPTNPIDELQRIADAREADRRIKKLEKDKLIMWVHLLIFNALVIREIKQYNTHIRRRYSTKQNIGISNFKKDK
jgi:hypothetical protein